MDNSKKKTLIIVGIVEAIILVFCLTVSIIVLVTICSLGDAFMLEHHLYDVFSANLQKNGQFIGTLQNNSTLFFCTIVLPLFIIFVVDGVYLIVYAMKKQSSLSDKEIVDIREEAKKQAREEVLAEMKKNGGNGSNTGAK